jgi:ABC-2 type transport system ATP-binding protein
MTTHYMDEAEVCDRIAIIDSGKIIACESPSGLKRSLRGDTIYITCTDNDRAAVELKEKFNLSARIIRSGLSIIVESGEKFIPKIFESMETPILSVSMKRPSLEDVFIHLTGKEIREYQTTAPIRPRR